MPAQSNPRDNIRQRDLQKIHIAKKQLGLEEDDYRAILERITGKTSAAELTGGQRLAVLTEFRRLGWRDAPPRARADQRRDPVHHAAPANHRMMVKIAVLLGAREWPYVDAMAQKMFGVDKVEFCTSVQLHKIIAALSYDQQRREKREQTDE